MKMLSNIPMVLEQSAKHPELYNFVADGKIDLDFIMNTLNNPPEDCRIITIFSNDRDLTNVVNYYGDYLSDKLKVDWKLYSIKVKDKTIFVLKRGEK